MSNQMEIWLNFLYSELSYFLCPLRSIRFRMLCMLDERIFASLLLLTETEVKDSKFLVRAVCINDRLNGTRIYNSYIRRDEIRVYDSTYMKDGIF